MWADMGAIEHVYVYSVCFCLSASLSAVRVACVRMRARVHACMNVEGKRGGGGETAAFTRSANESSKRVVLFALLFLLEQPRLLHSPDLLRSPENTW